MALKRPRLSQCVMSMARLCVIPCADQDAWDIHANYNCISKPRAHVTRGY